MTISLTPHFQRLADLHRLRHLTLVGAEYEMNGQTLSLNDRLIVQIFTGMMSALQIPMSEDLSQASDFGRDLPPGAFDVVNIVYAGGDFTKHTKAADVAIFCNLPLDNAARPGPTQKELPQWRDALQRSGANIAWISGSDSFTTEDLKGTNYIPVQTHLIGQSFLINRDYFETIEEYVHVVNSPLAQMILPYEKDGNVSFMAAPNHSTLNKEEWGRMSIRPVPQP
jgi:uncharacterized protein YlzI (FlbEa/FlbD family)